MAFALQQKLSAGSGVARRASRRSVVVQANARVDRSSKNDIIVSPSILSANFSKLGEEASGGALGGPGLARAMANCAPGPPLPSA